VDRTSGTLKYVTAPLTDPPSGSAALTLRLVARRHVDLRRVSSALCLLP
jgi:hypothetical protein